MNEQEPAIFKQKQEQKELSLSRETVFLKGQEVVVMRNPKNKGEEAYLETGWTVDEVDEESGIVTVKMIEEDGELTKRIKADTLALYQPETPALSEQSSSDDMESFAPSASVYAQEASSVSEQPQQPELITGVPDFSERAAEAARSTIDWSGEKEPTENAEAIEDLAELATESVVVDPAESYDAEQERSAEDTPKSKIIEAQIQDLFGTVPTESDRIGIWQYATAISPDEERRALDRVSAPVKSIGTHLRYKDLFVQLREARKNEGLI